MKHVEVTVEMLGKAMQEWSHLSAINWKIAVARSLNRQLKEAAEKAKIDENLALAIDHLTHNAGPNDSISGNSMRLVKKIPSYKQHTLTMDGYSVLMVDSEGQCEWFLKSSELIKFLTQRIPTSDTE